MNTDSTIRMNGRLTFDPKDYKEVARICEINATDAREHAGMLEYSFWVNDTRDTVYIHEHYESDEALENHLSHMDQEAVRCLLEVVQLGTMEIAARRTPKTEELLAGFGVPLNFYEPLARR